MKKLDCPVLVVGAGAAGLSMATLLAHHGVQSMLVEKRREVFVYPKARNLTFRALEILRSVGLGPAVSTSSNVSVAACRWRALSAIRAGSRWRALDGIVRSSKQNGGGTDELLFIN